jgi:drug/metabolite transporter (DMT)-like permease
MTKKPGKGLLLATASPLAYSVFNVGLRLLSEHISVWGMLLLRGWVGALLVAMVAKLCRKSLWGRQAGLLCLIGLLGSLSTACTTTAVTLIPVYQAIVILYLYPSQSIIFSAILNREGIGSRDLLGVGLAFAGCVLLIWPDRAAGLYIQAGHFFALAGGSLFSLSIVLIRRLGQSNSGLEPIFFYSLFAGLIALPLAILFGAGLGIDSPEEAGLGIGLGLLGSLGQLMAYAALRYLPAYKVGVLGSLEVLGGAAASWLIFREPMIARGILGGGLILFAAFGLPKKKLAQISPDTGLWPKG